MTVVYRHVGDEVIRREWLLLEPRENGQMRDEGEVPYGFTPSFPLFGKRIGIDNIEDAESDERPHRRLLVGFLNFWYNIQITLLNLVFKIGFYLFFLFRFGDGCWDG